MKRKFKETSKKMLFAGLFALLTATANFASSGVKHALIGSVEKVDETAKTVAVKTADGTVETVKWTAKTTVRGLEAGAKAVDFAGREGSYVVVHYTVKGADKTARTFEYLGRETPKVAEGAIKVAEKTSRTIVIKTAEGAEETFDLSERAVVDSGEGIEDAAQFTAKKTKDGSKVTIHYTDEAGRKVAHLIKRL